MSRARLAIVLGKFMPFHAGHAALCAFAASSADRVCIVVDRLEGEWPAADARAAGIREHASERGLAADVVALPRPMPQDPSETPDFWPVWRRALLEACPAADLIVSSEDYGPKLAALLAIRHLAFDPARSLCPARATLIRKNPFDPALRALIDPCARPAYSRLAVLRGPECSGKTTLLRALGLPCQKVPEAAEALIAAGLDPADPESLPAFARAQTEAIASALRGPWPLAVADSDAWSTFAWAQTLFGPQSSCAAACAGIARSAPRPDLVLLPASFFPFESAPHREFHAPEEARARQKSMQSLFLGLSRQLGENCASLPFSEPGLAERAIASAFPELALQSRFAPGNSGPEA